MSAYTNYSHVNCFSYVTADLMVKEDYLSMCHVPNTSSETLFQHLQDELKRLNIPLMHCRGVFIQRPYVLYILFNSACDSVNSVCLSSEVPDNQLTCSTTFTYW